MIIITKPEETTNFIRIPVSTCEVTATITIDKVKGITALYCGKIKKIRTYIFDKKVYPWTMAKAKKWVEEHHPKSECQECQEGKMERINKFIEFEIKDVNDEDRSFWAVASTGDKDRDGDIIEPNGWKLANFRKNPVILFGHGYRDLPVAKSLEIKIEDNKLMFKPEFATKEIYPFADTVFQMYKNKFIRTFSVGFVPLKKEPIDIEDEKTNCGKSGYRFTSQELLEISCAPVPSNVGAMAQRGMKEMMIKGFGLIDPAEIDVVNRGVVPFRSFPTDAEDAIWDAGKEIRAAEVSDLKIMCAWFDSENPEIKTSYKLPHHRTNNKNVVWRAVAAAMGALLGARGGVQIPTGDKQGVYNHLAKHYKQFEKEPPEYKDYSESELKKIYAEIWFEEIGDIITRQLEIQDEENYLKSGRVLSEKNRSLIKHCIEVLNELYNASEPKESEEEPKSAEANEEKLLELKSEVGKLSDLIK